MPLDGLGRMARGAALVLVLMTLLLLLLLLLMLVIGILLFNTTRASAASLMFNTTRTVQKHGNRAQF
jgi:hypothetical protein